MGTKYGACVETGRRFRVSRYFQNLKETLEKPEYKAKNIVTRSLGRARRNVSLSPPLCRHAPESRHSNHEINVKRMNLPLVVI